MMRWWRGGYNKSERKKRLQILTTRNARHSKQKKKKKNQKIAISEILPARLVRRSEYASPGCRSWHGRRTAAGAEDPKGDPL